MIRRKRLATATFVMLATFATSKVTTAQGIAQRNANDLEQLTPANHTPPASPDKDSSTIHKRRWRYAVHASDTLQLGFALSPEFNQTVTVQPDGYITLLYGGDVLAAGRSLPELTEAIKGAYSKILRNPEISVALTEFEKPYLVVGGQVGKPGKIDWRGDVTVTQAIALAGGFTDASKHSQVLLFRRVSDQWSRAAIINVKKMFDSRNLQEDPELYPGDMLFVPKNALSKIKPFLPNSAVGAYYNPATL